MPAVESLEQLVGGGRDVGEWNPGVFVWRQALPAHEILVTLAELARVEDGVDSGRRVIIGELEWGWGSVRVKVGRIVVWFEEGDVKDRV